MTSTVRVVRDWVGEPVRALVFYADAQGTGKSAESVLTEAVVDVPDAPGTFEATGGDEEVVLTWEIPADNGKPITGYAYRDSSVGATWSAWPETLPISADATRYPITTGLTNNTRYWFELRAHNDAGAGRVAAASATPKAALNISGETAPTVDEDSTRVAEYTTNAAAGTTVAWSLDGTDKTAFTLTETEGTGRLSFQTAPDYENPTDVGGDTGDNEYHVEVIATAGSSADTLDVTVAVQNVEEAGSIELSSTQPQVDTPLTATLTDPDGRITGANWTWQRAADKTAPWKEITSLNPNTVASSVRTDSAEPYPELSSYTPVAGDIGYLLRATVSYRDGQSEDDTDRKSAQSDTTEAVVDVPSAPGSLTASVQAQSADGTVTYLLDRAMLLRWAPADSHGSTITQYQVRQRPHTGSWSSWSTVSGGGSARHDTVQGLTSGVGYTFQVQARNRVGAGLAASVVDTATGTPAAPRLWAATWRGRVTLAWQAPPDARATITEYRVRWLAPGIRPAPVTVEGSADRYTVEDLDATEYTFRVWAYRTFGGQTFPGLRAEKKATPPPALLISGPTTPTVDEDSTRVGTYTLNVASGSQVSWSLSGPDKTAFAIPDGELSFVSEPDYETKSTYAVTVQAWEGADQASLAVTVSVADVNEAPVIAGPHEATVVEGRTPVGTYEATDPESDSIRWSVGGTDKTAFSITDGVLAFDPAPDFEAPSDADATNTYDVTVEASDGTLSDSYPVAVTVSNGDDAGVVRLSTTTPKVGDTIKATLTDDDGELKNVIWGWSSVSPADQVRAESQASATITQMTSTVRVVRAWVGEPVRALVFYDDGHDTGKSAESGLTEAVVDVPDAPSVSASAGNGQVVLTWDTPADNGLPITGPSPTAVPDVLGPLKTSVSPVLTKGGMSCATSCFAFAHGGFL